MVDCHTPKRALAPNSRPTGDFDPTFTPAYSATIVGLHDLRHACCKVMPGRRSNPMNLEYLSPSRHEPRRRKKRSLPASQALELWLRREERKLSRWLVRNPHPRRTDPVSSSTGS